MSLTNMVEVYTTVFQLLAVPVPVAVISSVSVLVALLTTLLGTSNYTADLLTHPNPLLPFAITYDFIVVGGGSAGATIATRLSENPNWKVLLLEAGGDPLITNEIPALSVYNLHHNETDWRYETVPQINSGFASNNNVVAWSRGKSLGGSSNLNLMIYIRGNPNDFNNWAKLTNDPQWNYENVLPYFKKSENYLGNYPNPTYHGTGGPLTVSKQYYQPLVQEWMDAAAELGLNNTDGNAYQTSTFFPMDVTIKNGSRDSTYSAFLQPVLNRNNLHVVRYAQVTKINLNSANQATGVTYQRNGQTITALASKEVILSAGVIGSPHLLLLSGIGPSAQLKSVGITPKVNLPGVGQNLQDHVLTFLGPFLLNETASYILDRNTTVASAAEYVTLRTGPLSFNTLSGIGFFSTEANNNPAWPDICAFYAAEGIHMSFGSDLGEMLALTPGILTQYLEGYEERDANWVLFNVALPKSSGNIQIKSSNPFVKPLIDPKYYSDPQDMITMVQGMKFLVSLFETTDAFQQYNATLIPRAFPGCENHVFKSDDYYECYARHLTGTTWHGCCTAKMGTLNDPMAVVDSNLRVINVGKLRVADASVMPRITNGNLNAPTIMIGEKASEMIKQTWSS